MTVDTEQSSIVFTGIVDGVPCNVPFPVQADTELVVRYDDDGDEVTAVLNVDYSVTLDPPDYETAVVTPLVGFAATSGGTISVRREVPYTQPTDVPTLASLATARVEQMFDRVVFICQQLRDALVYSLKFPTTDQAANIGLMPPAADRASKYLGFDAQGKPIAVASAANTSIFTAFGIAWGQLVNAAAGRAALSVSSTAEADALYIPKSLLAAIGDVIYASGVSTPARLGIGAAGQVLGLAAGVPAWITPSIKLTVWTANDTWTVDANMRQALLGSLGSGAGGGGVANTNANVGAGAGGGGAGSWALKLTDKATAGSTQSVTVGAAATGASAGNNNGAAGNDTSIGTLCVGKGGSPGTGNAGGAGGTNSAGGLGGVAGTGDITTTGAPGQGSGSSISAGGIALGAEGGSSPFGGGGRRQFSYTANSVTGAAASGYGGGGGGGCTYSGGGTAGGGDSTAGLAFALELVRP